MTAIESVRRELTTPRLRPSKMFIAAEQHRLGGWHCHGLIEYPMTHHMDSMDGLTSGSLRRLGYCLVNSVGSQSACSQYLSKYLLKDDFHGDWNLYGRKKFWSGV